MTLLLEFDPAERPAALANLKGVEDRCFVQVARLERVFAIADEDLERENAEKTSAVHFLRFELAAAMVAALKSGGALSAGVDHPHYRHEVVVPRERARRTGRRSRLTLPRRKATASFSCEHPSPRRGLLHSRRPRAARHFMERVASSG